MEVELKRGRDKGRNSRGTGCSSRPVANGCKPELRHKMENEGRELRDLERNNGGRREGIRD